MEKPVNAPHRVPAHTVGIPISIIEVRRSLEAVGHYITIDGRVTEQTAATLIPCPVSRPWHWPLEGEGPGISSPQKRSSTTQGTFSPG